MNSSASIGIGGFRTIVVAAMVMDALSSFYSHLPLAIVQHLLWLPEDLVLNSSALTSVISGVGLGALVPPNSTVWIATFCLYVLASIGLLLFRNWARWLFAVLALASLVFVSISGMAVHTPFESLLGLLVTLLDGAILALAFYSPIASLFTPMNHAKAGRDV